MSGQGERGVRRGPVLLGVAGAMLLALVVRALDYAAVLPADGDVLLEPTDSAYHARRAIHILANFPRVLLFDPYLAYPDGSFVAAPPLYAWSLAAIAWLFGGSAPLVEWVGAWSSPVLSALSVPLVFAIARRLGGPGPAGTGAGMVAAVIFALLPAHAAFGRLGKADHHSAVAFLAAAWLLLGVRMLSRSSGASASSGAVGSWSARIGAPLGPVLVHGAVIAAMALTWAGSLLPLGLAEGTWLLLGGIVACRRDALRDQALACVLAAALLAPYLLYQDAPQSHAFVATTLSWLHAAVLFCLAVLCLVLEATERWLPSRSVWERAARATGIGALLAAAAFLVLPLDFVLGVGFMSGPVPGSGFNVEQQPLFGFLLPEGREPLFEPRHYYGLFAFAIPLAPLLPFASLLASPRDERLRLAAWMVAVWTAVFGVLAVLQVRFGNEFAVPGSVGFGVALVVGAQALLRRVPPREAGVQRGSGRVAAAWIALLLALLLLAPTLTGFHMAKLRRTLGAWSAPPGTPESRAASLSGPVFRFMEQVRRLTPETSGYLGEGRPEYGILVTPTIGHATVYKAHRATPAGNAGPYVDPEKYQAVLRFFAAEDEDAALVILDALAVRYVVTSNIELRASRPFGTRLQRWGGSAHAHAGADSAAAATRVAHLERFRLIADQAHGAAFRLFEVVPGAVIVARGEPGQALEARLELALPGDRRFTFLAHGRADARGEVRLRVPYATGANGALRGVGPYRLQLGSRLLRAHVTEADLYEARAVEAAAALPDAASG